MGKLIIEGNAVYEIDEHCMQKKRRNRERMGSRAQKAAGKTGPAEKEKNSGTDMQKKSSGRAGSAKTGGK